MTSTETPSRFWAALAVLFVGNLILRLALMSQGPYHVDGLTLAVQVGKTMDTGVLQPLVGPGYPLTVVLGLLFALIAGAHTVDQLVWAVNLMSAVFGALSVSAVYFLAREMLDRRTAWISALLLSVSPVFFGIATYGNSQAPSVFFLILSFGLLARAQRRGDGLLGAAFCFGLAGAARIQDWFLLAPAMLFWLWKMYGLSRRDAGAGRRSLINKRLAFFWVISLTVVVVSHGVLWRNPGTGYFHHLNWATDEWLVRNVRGFFSKNLLAAMAFLRENNTVGGLFAGLAGAVLLFRKNRFVFLVLGLWLAVPFLFYGNSNYMVSPRFFAVILPPLLISEAYAITWLSRHFAWRGKMAAVFLGTMMLVPFWAAYPHFAFRHQHALLPDFVRWAEQHTEPDSVVVVTDDALFYMAYTRRHILKRPCDNFPITPEAIARFQGEVDALLAQGVNVYISDVGLYSYDAGGGFAFAVQSRYHGKRVGTHDYEVWFEGAQTGQIFPVSLYQLSRPEQGEARSLRGEADKGNVK